MQMYRAIIIIVRTINVFSVSVNFVRCNWIWQPLNQNRFAVILITTTCSLFLFPSLAPNNFYLLEIVPNWLIRQLLCHLIWKNGFAKKPILKISEAKCLTDANVSIMPNGKPLPLYWFLSISFSQRLWRKILSLILNCSVQKPTGNYAKTKKTRGYFNTSSSG